MRIKSITRLGALYLALLAVTVVLLSHFSRYLIISGAHVTFDMAIATTPYGLIENTLFNAHPEWRAVYEHVPVRHGFFQSYVLLLGYCIQFLIALLWLEL
ncbi:MAG: hypothetical protein A2270_06460 [Elusimicrobia bacterium RIFOXYA12_FULL_51_18]|nr:MAG: hypothetical protein A2270_06460 [Elusimicrobia bacterium RIFOXYA12_FULL_51_18]OGS29427.1 MAG: hypothetical protein A2218_00280 [Elusimicrobia bacterium RIFOXYA2_FULL_53_38]